MHEVSEQFLFLTHITEKKTHIVLIRFVDRS